MHDNADYDKWFWYVWKFEVAYLTFAVLYLIYAILWEATR